MAIYGVDLYAKSYYGIDIPVQFTVQPFIARQIEHHNLQVAWQTPRQVATASSAGKAWSSLRLIRNFYGFPVSATDGAILLEEPNTAPVQNFIDTTVPDGYFAYYSIFVLTVHDAWDSSRTYIVGDMVTNGGQNWVALATSQGQTPGSGSAWSATTSATEWVLAGTTVGLAVKDWKYSDFLYTNTPRAYKVNVIETTGSNPDFNQHLWKFDRIFGYGFDIMKTENDALLRINNIETTRDRFILCMAEQMGIGSELPDEPVLRRRRIMDAVSISQQKGSVAGLQELISDTTGWGATITQGYNLLLDVDQAAFAHPNPPVWDPNTRYSTSEHVHFQGLLYQATLANQGHTPDPSVFGSVPSTATPEYWYQYKPGTSGWRGVYGNVTAYAPGDKVVYISTNKFYTCLVANGPGTPAGVHFPSSPTTDTWWAVSNTLVDDRGVTISFTNDWSAATTYSVAQAVTTSPYVFAAPIWVAVSAMTGSTNAYWQSTGTYSDPTTEFNHTTGGISTWTASDASILTPAPTTVMVDGVPASGSIPARNCLRVTNPNGGPDQIAARTPSLTRYTPWVTGLSWSEGHVVSYNGLNYICTLRVVAAAISPDNDAAHWQPYLPTANEFLAIQQGVPIPRVRPWDYQRAYAAGDRVTANGNVYEALYGTTGSSPSGYRVDSRGWRWIGPEQALYTASLYYQRQAPTAVSKVDMRMTFYNSQNGTTLAVASALQYPVLFDRFVVDGPIGGAAPGSYPAVAAYASPFPITWIDAGGPWRVDYGIVHTTYPAAHTSGQLLVMSENVYGTTLGSDPAVITGTFVRLPADPNREMGLVFNLDTTARTYWMMSPTRLTKNTYAADFSTVSITQVATYTAIPMNSRVMVIKTGTNFVGSVYSTTSAPRVQLFSVTDAFSSSGTLHGFGERPKS